MALSNITFDIDDASITSIIGPNGAGKSTLINVISGIYKPDKGSVFVGGREITGVPLHRINRYGIKRTFQNIQIFSNLTVIENIMLGFHSVTKYEFINCILNLKYVKDQEEFIKIESRNILKQFKMEHFADKYASELPYGQQKKLEIARTIAANPDIIFLDEPAAGLNISETKEISEIIIRLKMNGKSIILIEHDMNMVMDISDKIVVLNFGEKIAEGSSYDIQNNIDVISAYLGKSFNNKME